MMKTKKVMACTVSVSLLAGVLAACGGTGETPKSAEPATTPQAQTEALYPKSITYWTALNANVAATMKNYNEIAAYKELEKITGTKVEFQHPPVGQEKDQFNLMIASGKRRMSSSTAGTRHRREQTA